MALTRASRRFSYLVALGLALSACSGEPKPDSRAVREGTAAPDTAAKKVLPIDVVKVSDTQADFATFQSHNQKVVENAYGVFMTYGVVDRDASNEPVWRLARSTDGGATFRTIHEGTMFWKVPTLETDATGSLYVVQPDLSTGSAPPQPAEKPSPDRTATFLRFDPSKDFANPLAVTIPNGGWTAVKFTTYLDRQRQRLYYATVSQFFVLDLDGNVLQHSYAFTGGPHGANAQYPHLSMDGPMLYAAWTSAAPTTPTYYDIHWMASADGGATWHVPGGATISLPVIVDDTGPAPVVSLPDEAGVALGPWLKSFTSKGGKLHFAYSQFKIENGRQHYVRFDQGDATKELDTSPVWQGAAIKVVEGDGFFATSSDPTAPLYAIMHTPDNRIGILGSDDLGSTWYDYAVSEPLPGSLSGLGGARAIVKGHIVGQVRVYNHGAPHSVWSFRVPAR